MLSGFKKLLGLNNAAKTALETLPPKADLVPELLPANAEPVITEYVDTNLLNTANAMMALKDNTATDGQKLKVLFDLKKVLGSFPSTTELCARTEDHPQKLQHDITGQHAIRLLLTIHNEPFIERIIADKQKHASYVPYSEDYITDKEKFYNFTFAICNQKHVTPQIVQEAYHLFFPQPDDLHYSTEKDHSSIKSLIFNNLLQKNSDGLQSFMVDHLFNRYANEKNNDAASDYASHIQNIFYNRPEIISSDHINAIPAGHNINSNFELLSIAFKKNPLSQTEDLMIIYINMANELVMNNIESFKPILSKYSSLKQKKGNDLHKASLSTDEIQVQTNYKNKKSYIKDISSWYKNNVELFLEKNPSDTLDEKMIAKLQPHEKLTQALISFENSTEQQRYRPGESTHNNPNPKVTPMEIFIEDLRIAGIYGEEARIEQVHLNTLRVYTS